MANSHLAPEETGESWDRLRRFREFERQQLTENDIRRGREIKQQMDEEMQKEAAPDAHLDDVGE